MTVSAEGFLLGNLLFDAGILLLSSRMCGHRSGWKCLIAGMIGASYAFCAFLPRGGFLKNPVLRFLICLVMVAVTYIGCPLPERKAFLSHVGTTYLCTWLMGGTGTGLLFSMGQRGWGFLPALLTAGIGTAAITVMTVRRNRMISERTVEVLLLCGDKRVTFPACVDTGNVLREPLSNLPVIVAEKGVLKELGEGERGRAVPYVTVAGRGILYTVAVDKVFVGGKEEEMMVAAFDGRLGIEGRGLVPGAYL